jgi:hypothetical protein
VPAYVFGGNDNATGLGDGGGSSDFLAFGNRLHVAGSLIYLLLGVAFVVLIIDLLSGRRAA